MSGKIASFEKFARMLSNWLNWIAGAGMAAMLALIVADIIAAKAFKWPIPGGIEMVGFLGVIVIAFSIAHTQVVHGHIEVEFLTTRLSKTAQKIIACIVYLFGLVLFATLAWKSFEYGHSLQVGGEVSMTQEIPFYPFIYGIAFCSVSVFLVLLAQLFRTAVERRSNEEMKQ
jgi:TRAP-type C4-dicarboxylate transport system permease small subunit